MPDDRSMSLGTVFTAKAGPLLAAIKKVREEMEKLNSVMKGQAKAAVTGGTAQGAAAKQSYTLSNTIRALKKEAQEGAKWNKSYGESLMEMVRQNGASVASMKHAIATHQKLKKGILDHASAMNAMGLDGKKWASEVKVQDLLARKLNGTLKQTSQGFVDTTSKIGGSVTKAKGLSNVISSLSNEFRLLGGAMKVTAAYMAAYRMFSAVSDAMVTGVQEIVKYDQALKNLQAITGATTKEVDAMDRSMKEVSKTTKFSTVELSDGMTLLAQAGFSAEESIQALKATADLATGTLETFENTTDLLTTAVFSFNLKAFETTRVADIMANAINKSKLTVDKLRIAFNYVGPVAYSTGTTIEEVAAAMMVLSNSGLRASTIGTSLRQMMSRLIAPSDRLREVFEANGIAVEDMDIKVHGFAGVMKNLYRVFVDAKTGAIDTAKAFDLFGLRAANAVLALVKSMRTGEFDKALEWTNEVGTAAGMAATQMEGLVLQFTKLANQAKRIAVEIGEEGVKGVLGGFASVIQKILDVIEAGVKSTFGGFVTELLVTNTAAFTLVTTLGLLIKAFGWLAKSGFKIVGGMLGGPLGVTIAAVSSLYAGLSQLFKLQAQGLKQAEEEEMTTKTKVQMAQYYIGALKSTYEEVSRNSTAMYKYKAIIQRLKTDFKELTPALDQAGENFNKLTEIMQAHEKELLDVEARAILRQIGEKPQATKGEEFFEGTKEEIWDKAMEGLEEYKTKLMDFARWVKNTFKISTPSIITKSLFGTPPPTPKEWAKEHYGLDINYMAEGIGDELEMAYKLGIERIPFSKLTPDLQKKFESVAQKIREKMQSLDYFGKGEDLFKAPPEPIFDTESMVSPLMLFEKQSYDDWIKKWEGSTNKIVGSINVQTSKIGQATPEIEKAFRDASEKYGVGLDLIRSIAWEESRFDPKAFNKETGATGLMQLLESTAKDMNVDMNDIVGNIEGGTKYLKLLLDKYQGNAKLAVTAYHAGMGNLAKGIVGPKTESYVAKVMSHLNTEIVDIADLYEKGLKPVFLKDLPEEVQKRFQQLYLEATKRLAPPETLVSPEAFQGMADYEKYVKYFVDETALFIESADKQNKIRVQFRPEALDVFNPDQLKMILSLFPKVEMGYKGLIDRQVEYYRAKGMTPEKAKAAADAELKEMDRIVKMWAEMKERAYESDDVLIEKFKNWAPLSKMSAVGVAKTLDMIKAKFKEMNAAVVMDPYPQFDKLDIVFKEFWQKASATQKHEIQQMMSDMTTKMSTFKKWANQNLKDEEARAEGIADIRAETFAKIYKMMDDEEKFDWAHKQKLADNLKAMGPVAEEEMNEQKRRLAAQYRWNIIAAGDNAGYKEMIDKKYYEDVAKLDEELYALKLSLMKAELKLRKESYDDYLTWKAKEDIRDLETSRAATERSIRQKVVTFKISEDEASRQVALNNLAAAAEEKRIAEEVFRIKSSFLNQFSDGYQEALDSQIAAQNKYADAVTSLNETMYKLNLTHLQDMAPKIVEMWKQGEMALESYLEILERLRTAKIIDEDQFEAMQVEAKGTGWDNFMWGLKKAAREVESFNQMWQKIGKEIADVFSDNLVDAFESFIDGSKSAKDAFKDFAVDTLKWIARLLMKMALMRAFSSIFGGSGGYTGAQMNSMVWLHGGGVVGKDALPVSIVNPQVFENARKFHTGSLATIKTNEQPAILKKDETVFTPGQMQELGDRANSLTISVPISINGAASPQFTSRLRGNIEETVRRTLREEMR